VFSNAVRPLVWDIGGSGLGWLGFGRLGGWDLGDWVVGLWEVRWAGVGNRGRGTLGIGGGVVKGEGNGWKRVRGRCCEG